MTSMFGGSDHKSLPQSYLATGAGVQAGDHLAVVQLISKGHSGRFTEQDAVGLRVVCEQIGQILAQVNETNFLSTVSLSHFQGVYKLHEVINNKYKSYLKQFFFELIAIRYGKNVVLKNKILRRQLNQQLELDKEFVRKIRRLVSLSDKFSKRTKQRTI